MLIDDAFEVRALTNTIIQLSNRTRRLMVRTRSYRASCEWTEALSRRFMHNQRKVAHPYGSFSPVRHYSPAAWYVDGAAAFAAMAKAMEEAEEQIFISGWWLSPDVQLIRSRPWQRQANGEPCGIDVRVRLLDIIWRKQCCGVKVRVTGGRRWVLCRFRTSHRGGVGSDLRAVVQRSWNWCDGQRLLRSQGEAAGSWSPEERVCHSPPQPFVDFIRRAVSITRGHCIWLIKSSHFWMSDPCSCWQVLDPP